MHDARRTVHTAVISIYWHKTCCFAKCNQGHHPPWAILWRERCVSSDVAQADAATCAARAIGALVHTNTHAHTELSPYVSRGVSLLCWVCLWLKLHWPPNSNLTVIEEDVRANSILKFKLMSKEHFPSISFSFSWKQQQQLYLSDQTWNRAKI